VSLQQVEEGKLWRAESQAEPWLGWCRLPRLPIVAGGSLGAYSYCCRRKVLIHRIKGDYVNKNASGAVY